MSREGFRALRIMGKFSICYFFAVEDSARNDVRWFMEQKKNLISYKLLPLFQTDWAISSNCSISITMSNAKCEISSPLSPSFSQDSRSLPHSLYSLAIQMYIQSITLAANNYFFLLAFVHFDVGRYVIYRLS